MVWKFRAKKQRLGLPVALTEYVHSKWEIGHNKCSGEEMIWLCREPVDASGQTVPTSDICKLILTCGQHAHEDTIIASW